MQNTVDASSKYQDSLPVSSDEMLQKLDDWGIFYTRSDHVPLRTVEESKMVQGQFLSSEEVGVILRIYIFGIRKNATFS